MVVAKNFVVVYMQMENKLLDLFLTMLILESNRTGADDHVEAVDKLQKSVKVLQKVGC